MENSLFRKSALEKISSPEQLNEYMKVAGPGIWAILIGLASSLHLCEKVRFFAIFYR